VITAESVVAKVVTFIVQKTVGKLVSLPFDKRRKACRSLTKLYYCVQSLDDVTEALVGTFEGFRSWGKADALVNALLRHLKQRPDHTNSSWLARLVARRNRNVAAVALANKNARIAWALLAHQRDFEPHYVSAAPTR